jgi:hypothetical protein
MSRITPELCKRCAFYINREKTCSRSTVAVSKTKTYYDFAKSVRLDPERCGPEGKLFVQRAESVVYEESL